jgi:integrase/recombinase XerD
MLTKAVETYIAMRRACGFAFLTEGTYLRGFAAYSDAKGFHYVRSDIAVEWARRDDRRASGPAGSVM